MQLNSPTSCRWRSIDNQRSVNEQSGTWKKWKRTSIATRWTLAWPCLPVLEVDMSTILQGRPEMAKIRTFDKRLEIQRSELTLDDNVTVLSKGRALHREGQRSTRGGLRWKDEISIDKARRRERPTASKVWLWLSSSDIFCELNEG